MHLSPRQQPRQEGSRELTGARAHHARERAPFPGTGPGGTQSAKQGKSWEDSMKGKESPAWSSLHSQKPGAFDKVHLSLLILFENSSG